MNAPTVRLLQRATGFVAGTLLLLASTACTDVPARTVAPRTAPVASAGPLEPVDDPIPGHIEVGAIQAQLETLTEGGGITAPNWGTFAPGQPNVLYVVDQDGPLWAVDLVNGRKTVCLNTRPLLVPLIPDGDERGFLGVAFHPGYAVNGLLYTYTSEPLATNPTGDPSVQPNHLSRVREWRVAQPAANPLTLGRTNNDQGPGVCGAVPTRVVLEFVQPQFNHNGGAVFFGRRADDRGLLYVTSGDGGCADDQNLQLGLAGEGPCIGHGPGSELTVPNAFGNGQRRDTPLGKILRLDPAVTYGSYGLDTPFPETLIYAYGFRNPFRASADRNGGAIWTGDAGQNHLEEVDARVRQGANYGWHVKEGSFFFHPAEYELKGFASDAFVFRGAPPGIDPAVVAGLVDPVAEYDHDEGVAVIGGFVYRGSRVGALHGRYVFGDYSRRLNNGNGQVFYLEEGDRADPKDRTPKIFYLTNGPINRFVLGFGEDHARELYVLGNDTGGPAGETGIVMRIVQRCSGDRDCRD